MYEHLGRDGMGMVVVVVVVVRVVVVVAVVVVVVGVLVVVVEGLGSSRRDNKVLMYCTFSDKG